jgi:hypothetical protein
MIRLGVRFLILSLVALLVISLLPACSGAPSAQPTTGAPQLTQPPGQPTKPTAQTLAGLTVGQATAVTSTSVAPSGGKIVVDKPGDALNGLTVNVPTGAYDAATKFAISQQAVEGHSYGDQMTPVSPLITIDNGGAFANEAMSVRIPIKASSDKFTMAFHYDPASGHLEALPVVDTDEGTVTVLSKHFSPVIAFAFDKAYLSSLNIDTGFKRGVDDWNLKNAGSSLSPQGFCEGMCLTAMWYFENEKGISGEPLWSQNPVGPGPSAQTPNFWQDDDWAIKLASVAQTTVQPQRGDLYYQVAGAIENEGQQIAATTGITYTRQMNRLQFYAFAAAFAANENSPAKPKPRPKPQLMLIGSPISKTGHAMVCYAIKGRTLLVADPNFPGDESWFGNEIVYDDGNGGVDGKDGAFEPYKSADSLSGLLDGKFNFYSHIWFGGTTALVQNQKLAGLWNQFRAGTVQGKFPEYGLRVLEFNDKAEIVDEYDLDRLEGITTDRKFIGIEPAEPFQGNLDIYRLDEVLQFEKSYSPGKPSQAKPTKTILPDANIIELKPGENMLGLYVSDKNGAWVGFDWVKVTYRNISGRWDGTLTVTKAEVTRDFYVDDPFTGKPKGMQIKKEECDKNTNSLLGKAQPISIELTPETSQKGAMLFVSATDGKEQKSQPFPYQLKDDVLTSEYTQGQGVLRFEGRIKSDVDKLVLDGQWVITASEDGSVLLEVDAAINVSKPMK